jgi:hypothetical protein
MTKEQQRNLQKPLCTFYSDEAPGKIIKMDLDITADDFVLWAHLPGEEPIS